MSRYRPRRMKMLLAERGVSQAELARVLGCNQATMSRKISGRSEFTVSELNKIKDYFGLSIQEMVSIFFAD